MEVILNLFLLEERVKLIPSRKNYLQKAQRYFLKLIVYFACSRYMECFRLKHFAITCSICSGSLTDLALLRERLRYASMSVGATSIPWSLQIFPYNSVILIKFVDFTHLSSYILFLTA